MIRKQINYEVFFLTDDDKLSYKTFDTENEAIRFANKKNVMEVSKVTYNAATDEELKSEIIIPLFKPI